MMKKLIKIASIFIFISVITLSSEHEPYIPSRATINEQKSEILSDEPFPLIFNNNMTPFSGTIKRGNDIEVYKNGLPHGTWKSFHHNGKPKSIVNWKKGVLNGNYTVFNKNGIKIIQNRYSNGKDHGNYTLYYPNGKKRIVGRFSKGSPVGTWKYYDSDGNLYGKSRF